MGKVRQYNYSKRYELKERQSWINRDNEIVAMSEYYDSLEDDSWLNDYILEDAILDS